VGQVGAVLLGGADVAQDLLELRPVGQRAHLRGGLGGVAEPDGPRPLDDEPHELVVDAVLHEQARAGHARLARGGEDAGDDAVARRLQVASAKTTWALLPPSSSEKRARWSTAAWPTLIPSPSSR
jgi:hypothetical protein